MTIGGQPVEPLPIRSVVFDLDGLLIDTEPIFAEVARRVVERRGLVHSADVLHAMMGTPAREALQVFRAHYDLPDTVEQLTTECSALFYDVLGRKAAPLLPGALALVQRLERAGIPRAIATSSRFDYVKRILEPHDLLRRFDIVLTADDIQLGKPNPEIYLKAAERLGHTPADMLVLEDSVNGLQAALAAGARCVVVPHALVRRDCLQGAEAVLDSLADPGLFRILQC